MNLRCSPFAWSFPCAGQNEHLFWSLIEVKLLSDCKIKLDVVGQKVKK